jgi:protein arginine N-methyltransferase 1
VNFYDSPDVHRLLVGDTVRTTAFRDSIAATVRPGATVLDVGAGSGILSLFAAQAGARRVYAIERAPRAAALARSLIARNGFADRVTVIEAAAEAARLPESVDVLVSEWLGAYGVDENMLAPVLLARDRWLKPGGVMVPSTVTAWLAPVAHEAGREATQFRHRAFDLDLSPLAPFDPDLPVWLPHGVGAADVRADPQPLWTTVCTTMPYAEAQHPYAAELVFRPSGPVNGLVTWFTAEMPGAAPLSNGPGRPTTHWGQFLFPIANGDGLHAGDELHVGFHNVPAAIGSQHIWAARPAGGTIEVHDSRRSRQPYGAIPWRVFTGETAAFGAALA